MSDWSDISQGLSLSKHLQRNTHWHLTLVRDFFFRLIKLVNCFHQFYLDKSIQLPTRIPTQPSKPVFPRRNNKRVLFSSRTERIKAASKIVLFYFCFQVLILKIWMFQLILFLHYPLHSIALNPSLSFLRYLYYNTHLLIQYFIFSQYYFTGCGNYYTSIIITLQSSDYEWNKGVWTWYHFSYYSYYSFYWQPDAASIRRKDKRKSAAQLKDQVKRMRVRQVNDTTNPAGTEEINQILDTIYVGYPHSHS